MTGADGKSARRADHVIDVGVISGCGMLTSAQRGSLGRQLQLIGKEHRGHLMILHHGCGHDADEAAHRTVRALGNWRIHGHPASEQQDGEVLLRQGVTRGLNRIHESKPPRQRDADIVDTSEILIVVRDRRPQPELEAAVKRAEAASLRVIYITEGANARTPSSREPDRPHKPSPALTARKNPSWAERLGHEDAIAGRPCRKYKTFLSTYKLEKSDASLQLWNAYCKKAQQASVNTSRPKPKQKPRWTRGLTLSDRHAPRRKAARRYDNVEPRREDLSPKNAALLMTVNQQNTLVDSWR
jgi:hypothetical protein